MNVLSALNRPGIVAVWDVAMSDFQNWSWIARYHVFVMGFVANALHAANLMAAFQS